MIDSVYIYLLARGIQMVDQGVLDDHFGVPDFSLLETIDMFGESIYTDDENLRIDVDTFTLTAGRIMTLLNTDERLLELISIKEEQLDYSERTISLKPVSKRVRQILINQLRKQLS